MKATQTDIKSLQRAVQKKNLSFVKKFVEKFGIYYLYQEISKEGSQSMYPDMYRFYLIHIAIDNDDLAMLSYFKEISLSPLVTYSIDANFNSRADQYLDHETIDLISYAQNSKCSEKTFQFIKNWVVNNENI